MRTTATPPLRGSRSSCCRPRPLTPAKRKSGGLTGSAALHSKRRHSAGRPEIFLIVPWSPRISTSAAPSTTTSMVHLPRSPPPPATMVARRWYCCAPAGDASTKTAAKTVSKRYIDLAPREPGALRGPQLARDSYDLFESPHCLLGSISAERTWPLSKFTEQENR